MENFLFFSVKYKKSVLFFLIILISFFAFFIKDLKFTGSSNKFFIKNDPSYNFYIKTLKKFGSDNKAIISIKSKNIFTYENLQTIYKMINEIKQLQGVLQIDSLFNKKNFIYRNNELHTNLFIDPYNIPKDPKILNQIKNDALKNPLIYKNLISDNGNILFINVMLSNSSKHDFNIKITNKINNIITKYQTKLNAQITQFGPAYISDQIIKYISHDMKYSYSFIYYIHHYIFYIKKFKTNSNTNHHIYYNYNYYLWIYGVYWYRSIYPNCRSTCINYFNRYNRRFLFNS